MAGTSISLQHFHDVQEINVQAVFIVHIDALEFLIFFSFSLVTLSVGRPENVYYMGFFSLSLSWKTRICVLYLGFSLSLSLSLKTRKWCVICFFLSLSLSWKTRTRSWTEKWRTCRLGTVLPPLLHFLELFKYSIS